MEVRFVIFSVSVPFFAVITCCTETLGNTESLQFVQSVNDNNTKEDGLENNMDKFNHLTTDSIVADVVNNPAFKGFGQYILPLEWRYDPESSQY